MEKKIREYAHAAYDAGMAWGQGYDPREAEARERALWVEMLLQLSTEALEAVREVGRVAYNDGCDMRGDTIEQARALRHAEGLL